VLFRGSVAGGGSGQALASPTVGVSLQNGDASLRVFTAAEVKEQEITPVQFVVKII